MDLRQPLLTRLRSEPVVIDGAMGTRLHERGILYHTCFEELVVSRPEIVSAVHEEYVHAGATLILTNTFGANGRRLNHHGLSARARELNRAAVKLARAAAGDRAYVGGTIGPSGQDEPLGVETALQQQAEALVEAGVDALVIETMVQSWELRVALHAAKAASRGKVPVIAHVSVDVHGLMADGTSCEDIGKQMRDLGADVIGVNCSHGPMSMSAVESMLGLGLPVSAVPSAGLPERVDDRLVYPSTPEDFGVCARRLFALGVRIVGGCCGTTPGHIEQIVRASERRE